MIRNISIILLLALSSGLLAQKPASAPSGLNSRNQFAGPSGSKSQKQDSLKKPRILKQWKLSSDFSEEVSMPFDTVFSLFNRFKFADRYSPVNAYPGNYGLPFYQISFFDRITDRDKFLYSYYYPLMHVPEKAMFMNTQVPFTELIWSFAGPRETSEQTFRIKHSQNINRFLNVGLIYDIVYSLGQYNYQMAEDKTFTLYSSYTGIKYKLYFAAGINNLISNENGGITTKDELDQASPRDVPVNLGGLNKAKSTLKNRNIMLVQRYTFSSNHVSKDDSIPQKRSGFFGLSGTFSHIFLLESNHRTYADSDPSTGFYDTALINSGITFDSLSSRSIKNTVRFDFSTDETRKFRLGGGVGIRNEIYRYYSIIPVHFPFQAGKSAWPENNNVLVGRLFNNIGEKFRWGANGELFLTGYRAGDFNLNGEILKAFDLKKGRASWLITGSMINRQPSFWYENWGSNNFEWHNNFNKEFRIDLGSSVSYPGRKAEIKLNYAIIKNYTDFDTTAHPSQYSGGLSVAALTVSKDLRLWKFHLATDLIMQKSSNSGILDLPFVTVRSAGFFEHLFKFRQTGGRLNIQLGVDVIYHTLYHPYSYMPATGRFYRQELSSTGNYPFMNAFLNFKLKRTRVFIMFDHVNYGMMGTKIGSNYDMIFNYPMNIRMLRYGLAWTFYN
jgi:hypothetical protein